MSNPIAWGIIGAGGIARTFAKGLAHSKTGKFVAIGSRTQESADKFGKEFNLPQSGCHGSYEALLADKSVEAVYIATPHPMHAEWAIKAAQAGKHILCEKPIGMNQFETQAIIEAARRHDVFLMEAFMYRCSPLIGKLVELLRNKAIGDIRIIQATFSFHAGYNPTSRIWANELGGGGILDVGCYAVSFSRMVAGIALGLEGSAEPISVSGAGRLAPTGADDYAVGILKFPGDIVAQVATGVGVNQDNSARIYGTGGNIVVPWPWIPAKEGGKTVINLNVNGKPAEVIEVDTTDWLYALEADMVGRNIARRQGVFPAMTWDDSLGNMRTLDQWRSSIGLLYDIEKPDAKRGPLSGQPLKLRPNNKMKYGKIAHLDKKVSRLVLGVDNQTFMPHADVMFDDYFERGGNTFDTAHIYGPNNEGNLGRWVEKRGVREQVVILDKGAHTPFCNPKDLVTQHKESLERLRTNYVDIYMMHRDNPEIPVGEFIDVLNELVKKGSIKAFGGSNWATSRIEAGNEYAKKKGLQGFSAASNNFSLARMIDAVWAGCIASSDPASRAWHTKSQLPLMPWSSQARGFFTDRAGPDKKSDGELVRCWYSEDNFRRRDRAIELAKKKNVLPINIALAYVLCQPFPTFPLVGPRTLEETRTTWPALDVELTADEVKWLNLES
ncbi:MAG: aldo/keto reductase [Planctomycetota bacterium]|nr:aldo/keto reductase [Planctomycetota bacterium]